ncbi:MAG: hypothetical protein CMJ25_13515 [Phycisphaerae bacterium]|nr:hypothetical protein [Phycisphaerae bacterium]
MENDQEKPTVSSPTCTALLCCPFCGGKAKMNDDGYETEHKAVSCMDCLSMTAFQNNEEEAVVAWNKRSSVVLTKEFAEKLDDFLCDINLKSDEFGIKAMFASIKLNESIYKAKAT